MTSRAECPTSQQRGQDADSEPAKTVRSLFTREIAHDMAKQNRTPEKCQPSAREILFKEQS